MDDLGATLRQAREERGWSLARLAAKTHFTKGHLSNVERRLRKATPDVILAYERTLGVCLDRRELVTKLAAGVVAPIAAGQLILHGFTSALTGDLSVEDWRSRVEQYGQDYMSVGAAQLEARLARDLVVMQQHLDSRSMWAEAARLLAVYGKTQKDAHDAIRWYRMAAVAADRSEFTDIRVWVRGRAALALAYEGAALPVAEGLADQALALSDTPSLGRLNAVMGKAHVAGVRGDKRAALAHLDDGRRVFEAAGSDELVSDYAVPEWRMWTFASMLLSRLGDRQAEEAQLQADRARPSTLPRFATHIELHRGLMMARSGDRASGVAYARRAMAALPPERHSLSLRLMLAEVERASGVPPQPNGKAPSR